MTHRRIGWWLVCTTLTVAGVAGLHAQRGNDPSAPRPGFRSPREAVKVIDLKRNLARLDRDSDSDPTDVELSFAMNARRDALIALHGSLPDINEHVRGRSSHLKPFYWAVDTRTHRFAVIYLTGNETADLHRIDNFERQHGRVGGGSLAWITNAVRDNAKSNATESAAKQARSQQLVDEHHDAGGGPNALETLYCSGWGLVRSVVRDPIDIEVTTTRNGTDWGYWIGDSYGMDFAVGIEACEHKPDDFLSTWHTTRCVIERHDYGCLGVDNNAIGEYYNDDFILGFGNRVDVFSYAAINVNAQFGVSWDGDNYIMGGWPGTLLHGLVFPEIHENCDTSSGVGACYYNPNNCDPFAITLDYCNQMCNWPYYGAEEDRDCNGWEDWDDCDWYYGYCMYEVTPSPLPHATAVTLSSVAGLQGLCGLACLLFVRRRRA